MTYDLFLTLTATVATVVAADGGLQPDMIALIGALLGTLIACDDARREGSDRWHFFFVAIGSSAVGSFSPGFIIHSWFPHYADKITWHVWAMAGFVFGMLGWFLIRMLYVARDAIRNRWNRWVNRGLDVAEDVYLPRQKQNNDDDDRPSH